MAKKLYLIDGHAQIYRAYYAPFGNLSAPSGEPTRATHVFCQMLLNLIRDQSPDYLAMVLDADESKLQRKQVYPDYKAQREPPPEDLPTQERRIIEILEAARVPILRKEGWEADDILATLVDRYTEEDFEIVLVSRDKDLEQLLSDRVAMYDPMKSELITPASLREKKGWTPQQAVDVQILMGDTSDNVPGVPGIGPKTAAKLIEKYGSAEAVAEHADELSPKQRENVLACAERFDMVRELVTLKRDVPIELELAACEPARFDWSAVLPIFKELNFSKLISQLPAVKAEDHDPKAVEPVAPDDDAAAELRAPERGAYRLVNTDASLKELADLLSERGEFTFDTETTGLKTIDADLVGVAIAWDVGEAAYVPVMSQYGEALPLATVRTTLGPLFADQRIRKIGHNLKYDMIVMRNAGMDVTGPLFDTMVAAFVTDPARLSYGLDRLVQDYLGHEMIPITDLIGKGRDQLRIDQVPLEHVAEYAAEDADYTGRLARLIEPRLAPYGVERLFVETEMPLLRVLTDMEYAGVAIDAAFLEEMSTRLSKQASDLVVRAHDLAEGPFNLDSPKQLGEVLFDKLGFRVVRRTKTARSTDAETLLTLARETGHELPQLLLDYRELQKLLSTYVDALPKDRARRTERIHTSYHQTGAITGRLSSSEPNLQNIPVRTELGRQIRKAFVPRSADEKLIVADYSQVELRVLAHFADDPNLKAAFADDRDIHAFVAAQVNGVALDDVTREMRANAKAVNFGIVYGQTAFGLAQSTGMSREEAQRFIDDYFAQYDRIRAFIDQCIDNAKRDGYVKTLLGRRRPIDNIRSRNANVRAQAERLAVNTVVQGSAADIIKIAMVKLHAKIQQDQLPLRLLLQVHDELVCEAPTDEADAMAALLADQMSTAVELSVPLKVDVAVGANWLEAK